MKPALHAGQFEKTDSLNLCGYTKEESIVYVDVLAQTSLRGASLEYDFKMMNE